MIIELIVCFNMIIVSEFLTLLILAVNFLRKAQDFKNNATAHSIGIKTAKRGGRRRSKKAASSSK